MFRIVLAEKIELSVVESYPFLLKTESDTI